MAIDITQAVNNKNFILNDVLIAYANNYNSNEQFINYEFTNDIRVCCTLRNVGENMPESNIQYAEKTTIDNVYFKYDCNTPLKYCYLTEPKIAGAQGICYHNPVDKNSFFSSGSLTGCSCAFLKKGGDLFFIHAGGPCDSTTSNDDLEMRRQLILRDLHNCVLQLTGDNNGIKQEGMTLDELRNSLSDKKFEGTLLTPTENQLTRGYYVTEEFSVFEYSTYTSGSYKDKNFKLGPDTGMYNMIAAVNKKGEASTGIRLIKSDRLRYYIEKAWHVEW